MTLRALLLTISIAVTVAGCVSDCGGQRPIRPSAGDVMTDGTKRQIVANNEFLERQCGIKP